MYNKAYLQNVVQYDSNDNFLSTIRHDALFAAFIMTQNCDRPPEKPIMKIDSIFNLPEKIDLMNSPEKFIKIKNELVTYGIALINYWLGFDKIIINFPIVKKQVQTISRLTYIYYNDSKKYYDALSNLEKHLMTYISITKFTPTINIDQMINLVGDELHQLMLKIPGKNPKLAYYINNALIDRAVDNFDPNCNLYKLYKSGSRFNKQQLARSCINIGLVADENNIIDEEPINSSLIEGITEKEFFISSLGTRKGLVDKARATPRSGYLERTLVMSMGTMEINEDDCGTEDGIITTVFNKDHQQSLIGKYYKLKQNENWKLFNNKTNLIGQEIILRSPMKCHTKDFHICKKCFGEKHIRTPYAGIVAAQCITERLTQLSLRSFHTSGSANLNENKIVNEFIKKYLIDIIHKNNKIKLIFNSNNIPIDEFKLIEGYSSFNKNSIIFDEIDHEVINDDVVAVIGTINEILRKQNTVIKTPDKYYEELIQAILTVGIIYSSYVEMVLTHLFMINNTEFWRYNYNKKIAFKSSDKAVSSKLSPLLGFLYQPNKITINGIDSDFLKLIENNNNLTIHERIFLQKYKINRVN